MISCSVFAIAAFFTLFLMIMGSITDDRKDRIILWVLTLAFIVVDILVALAYSGWKGWL